MCIILTTSSHLHFCSLFSFCKFVERNCLLYDFDFVLKTIAGDSKNRKCKQGLKKIQKHRKCELFAGLMTSGIVVQTNSKHLRRVYTERLHQSLTLMMDPNAFAQCKRAFSVKLRHKCLSTTILSFTIKVNLTDIFSKQTFWTPM